MNESSRNSAVPIMFLGQPASCRDPEPGPVAQGPAPIHAGESHYPNAPDTSDAEAWITHGGSGAIPKGRTV